MTNDIEVLALHYAQREGRRGDHFLGLSDDVFEPHPTSYFMWLVRTGDQTVLVDAGLDEATASGLAGLRHYEDPLALLAGLDVGPSDIDTVVLTHLHYDHTGVIGRLPNSRVVAQKAEWDYWHGPWERVRHERWLRSAADFDALDRARSDGRLTLAEGDTEVAPGIDAHLVGGHTPGMQVVRVAGAQPVVVASDASHFYENLEQERPAPLISSMPQVYSAYDRIVDLAGPQGCFLPGHDPEVLTRFEERAGSPHVVRVR